MWQCYTNPEPDAQQTEESVIEERTEEEVDELIKRSEHRAGDDIRGECTGAVKDHRPINYGRGPHDKEFGLADEDEGFEAADPDEDEFADHR